MPRNGVRLVGILLLAGLLSVAALAQQLGPLGKQDLGTPRSVDVGTRYQTDPGTGLLVFHVFAEKSGARLDGQVQMLLTNLANNIGLVQRINGDQDGVFPNLAIGNYEIEVSAFGYFPARQRMQVVAIVQAAPIEIVLHRDPDAIRLDLEQAAVSARARKEARHGVSLLRAGDLDEAQKHLETADRLSPLNSDLNFLLGYLYFQKRDYARAENYLSTSTQISPHNAQALTLLGRTDLAQENYPAARSALEQAVLADPENWLPHNLLADTYLQQKEYNRARDEAQIAIAKGEVGKTSSPAQVVLGQALLGLGQWQDAVQVLDAFLKDSPQSPLVYQIQNLIAELKSRNSSSTGGGLKSSDIDTSHADPLGAVPNPTLTTHTWRPPDIDDVKLTTEHGVTCPVANVLEGAGKRVQEFVQDLSRFGADEQLLHRSIDEFGFAAHTETRQYDYVATVSQPDPDTVSIDEYRGDKIAQAGYPDAISSTGFITLAFAFHPAMQNDFDFTCEGRGNWNGQPSWLVHFQQRHDRPNHLHSYTVGTQVFPVDLKGRAWISVDKFEIVRMEADLIKPLPEIQLLGEHQIVEYGPVPFPKKNTTLWLPQKAEIYFEFRKHRYFRRHSFDHYMLYSVDTEEKPKVPKDSDAGKKS
jgi:tetratricopeptide (TPR) repeat protein